MVEVPIQPEYRRSDNKLLKYSSEPDNPFADDYFHWLIEQVGFPNGQTWYCLFKDLHSYRFIAKVPNDGNRIVDGMNLRDVFLTDTVGSVYQPEMAQKIKMAISRPGCSILEMLVALSFRMEYLLDDWDGVSGKVSQDYFWEFLINLGLTRYSDTYYYEEDSMEPVENILSRFVNRKYKMNGLGGLFPLKNSGENQRGVEIWYQMMAYIHENYAHF